MSDDGLNMVIAQIELLRKEMVPRLERIEAKQDVTNGRVNRLEAERDERRGYDRAVIEASQASLTTRRTRVTTLLQIVAVMIAAEGAGLALYVEAMK